ncbi:MAG TPA: arginine deiminase family protein [Thermoanaerobaculia bacterium]|jgi:dimethylargininase|nr:arginine deiminase family protein [Thermoanaerobaculia bacterium]
MGFKAITRSVSASIGRCELTHAARTPINVDRAREQHRAYESCLASLGCEVRRIPEDDRYPDAVFIEDTAIVLDELAILTRPGAESRRGEVGAVAEMLRDYRTVASIDEPGTLDGGDVLLLERVLYVGRSQRTTSRGIDNLRELVAPRGYRVEAVTVDGCLHLKSAVTRVSNDALLMNRAWLTAAPFGEWRIIDVDPSEPAAANALRIGNSVVFPEELTHTRRRLEAEGIDVRAVPASELAKAEGGVTCCSLILHK